jgi:carbohydrate-selective porin OprB
VFTGGVYAITDIFDQNAFAHDPRTQFMNWSMMDYAAWDTPADARGYTRGLAIEYYHDDWAFRIGRNLLPVESNGMQLNGDFSNSYSDNAEIERGYEINGQPGRIRVLGFRNVAKFGNFNDAMGYSRQFGGTPDVGNVRKEQSKFGFGVSLEQNITDSVGVFARYSWNNGQTEGYSFTDVNNSALVGVSIKGKPWARPDDVLGIAYASNGISGANRDYLAAGGSNFFCGDGNLNYQREGIFEIYYSFKVTKAFWLTADYQRIQNPCFNTDRGPVNVYTVRGHVEF